MKRAVHIILIALILSPAMAHAEEDPLPWANSLRHAAGVPAVREDPLLSATARNWAARLAAAGVLAHRGEDGSSALDRYRAEGGTEARVGEILGAGGSLSEVEKAWERSGSHAGLVADIRWTHMGWGRAAGNGAEVWVVVFCEKLVEDLTVEQVDSGLSMSGRFVAKNAGTPLLLSGIQRVPPAEWDADSRSFRFLVRLRDIAGYIRLGYLGEDGEVAITNAFTWPPGRGSRAGPDRSSTLQESP